MRCSGGWRQLNEPSARNNRKTVQSEWPEEERSRFSSNFDVHHSKRTRMLNLITGIKKGMNAIEQRWIGTAGY